MDTKSKKAVILVSGGIDSSTMLAMLKNQNFEIYAISFDYMQRHAIELQKIQKFIKTYNVKDHKIVSINLRAFGGSALTDDNIEVPKYKNTKSDNVQGMTSTYVPARNTIFLSYALGFAETVGAHDIFIGAHASDYANYPDCRPEFFKAYEEMANLGTKEGTLGQKIRINTPLMEMTKSDIIAEGLKLGVDFSNTISCYDPTEEGRSCGKCLSCIVRLEAFKDNGKEDPIFYARY